VTWTVDSTTVITAANQQEVGRIRIYAGACPDLRALLTKTNDPDEFLLPIGWTFIVVTEGDKLDYWYKSPTGQQWTDRQCSQGSVSGVFNWKSPWVIGGFLVGGYLLWKYLGKKKTSRRKRA